MRHGDGRRLKGLGTPPDILLRAKNDEPGRPPRIEPDCRAVGREVHRFHASLSRSIPRAENLAENLARSDMAMPLAEPNRAVPPSL